MLFIVFVRAIVYNPAADALFSSCGACPGVVRGRTLVRSALYSADFILMRLFTPSSRRALLLKEKG